MKKYLTKNYQTIDELKKDYKKWAFKLHPDVGGSTEAMKILNNEYELCIKEVGKATNKKYSFDEDFINIIDELIKMQMDGVTVEIMGFFVWIYGNTKPYKDQLGKNGLKLWWHSKKKCWYYKPSWYTKRSGSNWDFEKIRNTYGSEVVETEGQTRKANPNLIPA